MEANTLFPRDYWEHLYNHKQICEALVREGSRLAKALFRGKVNHLILMHHITPSDELSFILLTSLNRSLYDYFVLQLNLSFTACCYNNRVHTHKIKDIETLLAAGDRVIDAYAACLEDSRASHPLIEKVCGYIRSNLDGDLSLAAVSAEVFVSKSHLCHIFKTFTSSTFCEYVREQRIEHARALLSSTQQSVDDIAAECGFHSATYFATVFKSEMGMSPSAFRQEFSGHVHHA